MKQNERLKELNKLKSEFQKRENELLKDADVETREKYGAPIKELGQVKSFIANGKKFKVHESLTLGRFEEFERLQIYVAYGMTYQNLFGNLNDAWNALNETKPADAAAILYNIMNGTKNQIEKRENEILMICTLFICYEGEDLTTYDEVLALDKIDDWKKEGIDYTSFFDLAFGLVSSFIPSLETDLKDTLKNKITKSEAESNTSK